VLKADTMDVRPFRVLSLDGGGILGAFAASAVRICERAMGRRVVEHFDLLTRTSTGEIIAIGLTMGATAEQIGRFYETMGRRSSRTGAGSRCGSGGWGCLPAAVLDRDAASGNPKCSGGPAAKEWRGRGW
jgi:hypothetical protein